MAAAKEKTLDDLFLDTLRDIYYAEKQILKSLPKMAKAAQADELREAFEHHREETQGHIERVERVFELLGTRARGVQCEAINGIIEEGKEIMDDYRGSAAIDAGLVASAQAVEHYEMVRYGTLHAWAKKLGMTDAAKLIEANLAEEKAADAKLDKLATSALNAKAA